jgi:hypothetical protein
MTQNDLRRLRDRVERIISLADSDHNPEAKSNLACFACVLTSAMIEVACREYVHRYVENRAQPNILRYVDRQLYFFQNPSTGNIDDLLRSFDPAIAEAFADAIGDEGKDAIDSVVNNKNQLAHGKGSGLGLDTMKRYYSDVWKSIESIRDVLCSVVR